MAHALSPHLNIPSGLRVGFDGHEVNHEALLRGELHLYADYTGTALHRYLRLAPRRRDEVHPAVQAAARKRWNVEWLDPFGFDNTYGLIMRAAHAAELGVRQISDLARHAARLTLGGTPQFLNNDPPMTFAPGGYPGLVACYGLCFGETRPLPTGYGESFEALERGDVDVLADFVVNPRIVAFDLLALDDDLGFFAAYHAAPIVRGDFLERYPQTRALLERLAWRIDSRAMAALNYAMEFEGRDPSELAEEFLERLD